MQNSFDILLDSAHVRSNLYGLFSLVFRSKPSVGFIEYLKQGEIFDALESFPQVSDELVWLRDLFGSNGSQELEEILGVAYTDLFITPKKRIIPYESAFSQNKSQLMGPAAVDVMNYYVSTGFNVPDEELPDHIYIELEFMQYLCLGQIDKKLGRQFLEIEIEFYNSHLSKWAPELFMRIKDSDCNIFYRIMADLAIQLLEIVFENPD